MVENVLFLGVSKLALVLIVYVLTCSTLFVLVLATAANALWDGRILIVNIVKSIVITTRFNVFIIIHLLSCKRSVYYLSITVQPKATVFVFVFAS